MWITQIIILYGIRIYSTQRDPMTRLLKPLDIKKTIYKFMHIPTWYPRKHTVLLTLNHIKTTELIRMGLWPFEAERFVDGSTPLHFWITMSVCFFLFIYFCIPSKPSLFFDAENSVYGYALKLCHHHYSTQKNSMVYLCRVNRGDTGSNSPRRSGGWPNWAPALNNHSLVHPNCPLVHWEDWPPNQFSLGSARMIEEDAKAPPTTTLVYARPYGGLTGTPRSIA